MSYTSTVNDSFSPSPAVSAEVVRLALRQTLKSTVSAAVTGAMIVTCVPSASWTSLEIVGDRPATSFYKTQYLFDVVAEDRALVSQMFESYPSLPGFIEALAKRLHASATVRLLSDAEGGGTFVVAELVSGLTSREEREHFEDRLDAFFSEDSRFEAVADVLIVMQA